jgi:hypothetical protein
MESNMVLPPNALTSALAFTYLKFPVGLLPYSTGRL